MTTYYRDIKNMIGAREVVDKDGNSYTVYDNSDYGSCKGVDLAIETIGGRLFNWSVDYSYMIARGNASDPTEWYYDYYTQEDNAPPLPTVEYPLSYDQRHNLTAVVDFRVPRGEKVKALGITMPDAWGVNLLAKYGSGQPYTKYSTKGERIGSLNGERMPYIMRFDLRFNKNFYLSKSNSNFFAFFVEVENLFNRQNIINVYSATGEPDDDGTVVLNAGSGDYQQHHDNFHCWC